MTEDRDLPRHLTLDGGFLQEARDRFGVTEVPYDSLGSVGLTYRHPDWTKEIHYDYLKAGAQLIMTNSYRANIKHLMEHLSLDSEEAFTVMSKASKIATDARDEFWENCKDEFRPLVVGSVGTYGAYLPTGTDYAGLYIESTSIEEMVAEFRDKALALLQGGADILGFETIPAKKEAEAVSALMREMPNAKAWICFCCKDGKHVCHGERFSDAVSATLAAPNVIGVGINCTGPQYVTSLLKNIPNSVKQQKKIVLYPNNGRIYDNVSHTWSSAPDILPLNDYVHEWMNLGANWIGGCCHVGPDIIMKIRRKVDLFTI